MAVCIRMKMIGRKHRPFFRICVIDKRKARDGLPIEEVGTYDPMVKVKSKRVKLDMERVDYWISKGAQPSDRVKTLIKKIKTNRFGEAQAAPEAVAPKALTTPEAAPAESAPAAEGDAAS